MQLRHVMELVEDCRTHCSYYSTFTTVIIRHLVISEGGGLGSSLPCSAWASIVRPQTVGLMFRAEVLAKNRGIQALSVPCNGSRNCTEQAVTRMIPHLVQESSPRYQEDVASRRCWPNGSDPASKLLCKRFLNTQPALSQTRIF